MSPQEVVRKDRGSALLLCLGVLALLAVMATTFVTMMRMDSKLNARYVEDVQCEMLARGMLEYCRGILADDLDRSMKVYDNGYTSGLPSVANRYANRDTAGAFISGNGGIGLVGVNTDDNVRNTDYMLADNIVSGSARLGLRLGIPPTRKFWLAMPGDNYGSTNSSVGGISWGPTGQGQVQTGSFALYPDEVQSFGPNFPAWGSPIGPVALPANGAGYDVWVPLYLNGDNNANWVTYYNDPCNAFLTSGDPSVYLPGKAFTGDPGLPGGRYWRWAMRIALPENGWYDFNMVGNTDKADVSYMAGMDGQSLRGRQVAKRGQTMGQAYETDGSNYGPKHLGLLGWTGYSGDTSPAAPLSANAYSFPLPDNAYDAVFYSPLQISLRELLFDSLTLRLQLTDSYMGIEFSYGKECDTWADAIIHSRYGVPMTQSVASPATDPNTGVADARYRPGWRADGGSFCVIPNPTSPQGKDSPFGAEEALEHAVPTHIRDNPIDNPQYDPVNVPGGAIGSRLFNTLYNTEKNASPPYSDADAMTRSRMFTLMSRGFLSTLSRDTILRGKIWFTETHGNYRGTDNSLGAYAVPANKQNVEGEWRSISILKRVNLNMLGAHQDTVDGVSIPNRWAFKADGSVGDNTVHYANWPSADPIDINGKHLKRDRWMPKSQYEQDRCYYMVKGALNWYGPPYRVGNNDAVAAKAAAQFVAAITDMVDRDQDETVYRAPDSSGAIGYGTERFPVINEVALEIKTGAVLFFRVELFNPCENIPWLPDNMEAIDLGTATNPRYALRVFTPTISKTYELPTLDAKGHTPATFNGSDDAWSPVQTKCLKIGNSGVTNGGASSKNRYLHVSLDTEVKRDFPLLDLQQGVQVELIKHTKAGGDRVVDRAASWGDNGDSARTWLRLATYNNGTLASGNPWVGIYRRIDPLNARTYHCTSTAGQCSVVHNVGYELGSFMSGATLGAVNNFTGNFVDSISTTYKYESVWCRDLKIPDTDLPSVGWLGEAFLYTYMDPSQGPITEASSIGQIWYAPGGQDSWHRVSQNLIDTKCKLNLFKPFNDFSNQFAGQRNLHIYDIFTCWDPSNDGIDNDGNGVVDNDEEVVVCGKLDINTGTPPLWAHLFGMRQGTTTDPRTHMRQLGYIETNGASNFKISSTAYMRGLSGMTNNAPIAYNVWFNPDGSVKEQIPARPGPLETIGDLMRSDRFCYFPGHLLGGMSWRGGWPSGGFTWNIMDPDNFSARGINDLPGPDNDGDGKIDECDQRDAPFTWYANVITTRNMVFNVEIIAEVTDPPYYPGQALGHPAYKVDGSKVYSQKHIYAVLDRSQALSVNPADGTCEFTKPVKILVQRWAQVNK